MFASSTLFALLSLPMTVFHSSDPRWEGCYELDRDDRFPPKVPHQVLNDSYLSRFDEILVIGDIHGCIEELKLLLKSCSADNSRVLKILTGDMVRKGPKSLEVVRYVRGDPSILSVRGNNDENALSMMHKPRDKLKKSDKFVKDLDEEDVEFLRQLPYSIRIPDEPAVIVVHGAVVPGVPVEQMRPFDIMNTRNLQEDDRCPGGYIPKKEIEAEGEPWASLYRGPERVVFGHDRKRSLQFYPYATGVDSACVYGQYLTGLFLKGPRKGQTVSQKALKIYYS